MDGLPQFTLQSSETTISRFTDRVLGSLHIHIIPSFALCLGGILSLVLGDGDNILASWVGFSKVIVRHD